MPNESTFQLQVLWENPQNDDNGSVGYDFPERSKQKLLIGRSSKNAVVLNASYVGRSHAYVSIRHGQVTVHDDGSQLGVQIDGDRIGEGGAPIENGGSFSIGDYTFRLIFSIEATPPPGDHGQREGQHGQGANYVFQETELVKDDGLSKFPVRDRDETPAAIVSVEELRTKQALKIEEIDYLAIGGGLGSFIWSDHLRVFGVRADQIRSIGLDPVPYAKYFRLCKNSQIPEHERLRSNSESCPDNLWGFPGYAVRESFSALGRFRLISAIRPVLKVFFEPVFETFTPQAKDVFDSVDRESHRIGWNQIFQLGRISAIRKTDDGRYAVFYSVPKTATEKAGDQCVVIARFAHLCTGYPGTRLLDDLQNYRVKTGDEQLVVNAYEPHDQIYDHLAKTGGSVLVRGRGIVASRILQRLKETRDGNRDITVYHLNRSTVTKGNKFGAAKRRVWAHWEYQPFNWPKACWGGQLQRKLEAANDTRRSELISAWGGTTTADRRDWMRILRIGLRDGWYQQLFGTVSEVRKATSGGGVETVYKPNNSDSPVSLKTDYIIDCVGLVADLEFDGLLSDLLTTYELDRNQQVRPDGRSISRGLRTTPTYEVEGMANGIGRFFAAGQITGHGILASVDSFLGLQFAAMRSVRGLRKLRAPGIRSLRPFRSFRQWLRWCRNAPPN